LIMNISRRAFLTMSGASLAIAGAAADRRRKPRFPLSFSTLGCPAWSWSTILDTAAREGYAAIELRGLEGTMDLPSHPAFAPGRIASCLADLDALELRLVSVDSSVAFHTVDAGERSRAVDDGQRHIELAHRLRAPYVRVFGDKVPPGDSRPATISRIVDGLRTLSAAARGSGVTVLIESHGDFTDAQSLRTILTEAPEAALLWDAHNTLVGSAEPVARTFAEIGRFVRHTHLKDSRSIDGGRRYVLTGLGTVPIRETIELLARAGYAGYYGFEWEKAWHPEIEEPEVALPHYARVMREWLEAAGVRPR
jgi:sugar phosphate isomerase/epimerase